MKTLSNYTLYLAKETAREVWSKYDDTHGYRTEKQTRNDSFDDMLPIWQQFDLFNQREFEDRIKLYLDLNKDSIPAKEIFDWIEEYKTLI